MANPHDDDDDDLADIHDLSEARDPLNGDRWDNAQEGAELLSEGDNAGAVAELERVILADSENEYAYFFLGSAHFEGARFDKAMKAYLEAARIKPGYIGALAGVGHSLRMVGKHHEALRVAKQILLKSKDDQDGLHIAGLAHFALGQGHAAAGYLERFLATKPEIEAAQEARGLLDVVRGQFEQDPELS